MNPATKRKMESITSRFNTIDFPHRFRFLFTSLLLKRRSSETIDRCCELQKNDKRITIEVGRSTYLKSSGSRVESRLSQRTDEIERLILFCFFLKAFK